MGVVVSSFNFKDYVFCKAREEVLRIGDRASIVFPESSDVRILKAAIEILKERLAGSVVLIGERDKIFKKLRELVGFGEDILEMIRVIDPNSFDGLNRYLDEYFTLKQNKGLALSKAMMEILDDVCFSMMMVRLGDVKTCVCGSLLSSSRVLRSALTILPMLKDTKLVSSFTIMDTGYSCGMNKTCFGHEGILLFADCAVVVDPTSTELAEIAIQSASSFKNIFGIEPKVALLSFSTKGSAYSTEVEKVQHALEIAKSRYKDLLIDGELQVDAALIKSIADRKCSDSLVAGAANILIFPNLAAGNIGYKLVERLAFAKAYGPFLQGFQMPVSDLSRGCSVDDIVLISALMIGG
ncbi:phosphate acetyltransferase [Borrelia sp. BU AG58]|uniref:phosphate acetyltransferase n=1 Tax=Borrelia sp. BU AG58 TaxID=2887345 RepID=UPI001E3679F6|nr:phosphate acetyltransferase [Borrelia sp. BU AG58]UER67750.1 phosphate acetyltransferase [Borrelia sp. BU AG58]